MYGFEESQATRRQELTNNKTEKGTFYRIKLKDLFGFADQEKITYGMGYSLTLKHNELVTSVVVVSFSVVLLLT